LADVIPYSIAIETLKEDRKSLSACEKDGVIHFQNGSNDIFGSGGF
jgi:hypothetical protein